MSKWTPWTKLTNDMGGGLSCYFNRGLVLSQFVARYLKDKKISPAKFKAQLKKNVDPKFRKFLEGDLGTRIGTMLKDSKKNKGHLHAALYELGDEILEDGLIALGSRLHLILANGSDKSGDGNADARERLNDAGITTIDRLLKSKGLGHNKFVVISDKVGPRAVWTGSTNWSTHRPLHAGEQRTADRRSRAGKTLSKQWGRLSDASPPTLDPANFPKTLRQRERQAHEPVVKGTRLPPGSRAHRRARIWMQFAMSSIPRAAPSCS